jgi:hypothetical protein
LGRRNDEQAGDQHDDALDDAPGDERVGIAGGLDHVADWNDGEGGAYAVCPGGYAGAQTTMVREPFDGVSDAGAVDAAAAHAADDVGDDKPLHGGRQAGPYPADADEQAAEHDDGSLAEPIDQGTLEGHEPRLSQDKAAEGGRDLGQGDELGLLRGGLGKEVRDQGPREQRPGVLEIGDGHHGDHGRHELPPTIDDQAPTSLGGHGNSRHRILLSKRTD